MVLKSWHIVELSEWGPLKSAQGPEELKTSQPQHKFSLFNYSYSIFYKVFYIALYANISYYVIIIIHSLKTHRSVFSLPFQYLWSKMCNDIFYKFTMWWLHFLFLVYPVHNFNLQTSKAPLETRELIEECLIESEVFQRGSQKEVWVRFPEGHSSC